VRSRGRKPKELFLSHTWKALVDGSSCHERVKRICKKLERRGWQCWLDEEVRILFCFFKFFLQRCLDEEVRILKRILMVPFYMESRIRD
jgi:hypothetical protein